MTRRTVSVRLCSLIVGVGVDVACSNEDAVAPSAAASNGALAVSPDGEEDDGGVDEEAGASAAMVSRKDSK